MPESKRLRYSSRTPCVAVSSALHQLDIVYCGSMARRARKGCGGYGRMNLSGRSKNVRLVLRVYYGLSFSGRSRNKQPINVEGKLRNIRNINTKA